MYRMTGNLKPSDYAKAVEFVRAGGTPRVSALQKHFGDLGYCAAAALMERMEGEGVVTRCDHLGHRKVLPQQR